MSKKKQPVSLVRSLAAEYLTFVAATGEQSHSVEMRYEDENIWLTQKMMATRYDVSVSAINQHLKRLFADKELMPEATIKKYLIVQAEGSRSVQGEAERYSQPLSLWISRLRTSARCSLRDVSQIFSGGYSGG